MQNLPANLTRAVLPLLSPNVSSYSLVPSGQFGLNESALPLQPLASGGFAVGDINELSGGGTVVNGGNGSVGEGWARTLSRELANRYMSSMFCSWYATGGSIPGLLARLSDQELNVTFSVNNTGKMFEKVSAFDIDVAGGGGEYTVQAGFGWSNGVVLYFAAKYGAWLATPNCPAILITPTNSTTPTTRKRTTTTFVGKRRAPVWRVPGSRSG